MPFQRIILLRHAHSEKNAEDRHGGEGRGLTSLGYDELTRLTLYLKRHVQICNPRIFYTPITQAEISARFLGEQFKTICDTDQRIRPLNLGVLSGLSREEAAKLFPEPAKRLEEWRRGDLRFDELEIPNAENFSAFWDRGVSFLMDRLVAPNETADLLIVGTRSILILLSNILLRNTFLTGKPYTVFEFNNSGITILRYIRELDAELICQNETSFLYG